MSRTLLRAVGVGAAATLVDLGALWFLVTILGWPPTAANVPALLLGVVAQFVGCKLFAFEDFDPRALVRQGSQFALVETGAVVLNALLFHLFVTATMPYPAARLCGSALVYFGYSYPLWRRIFTTRGRQS